MFLIISGVEVNPGPTTVKLEDIVHRLDGLLLELHDTWASLSTKIDDSVRNLTTKLRVCEDLAIANSAHLGSVEQAQMTMKAQHATLLTPPAAATPAATVPAPTSPPLVMEDVVRELHMRTSRQANVLLTGILPSPHLTDTAIVTNLLQVDLGINTTVTRCVRLSKPSTDANRLCILLATLSSEADACTAILSAMKLCNSVNAQV